MYFFDTFLMFDLFQVYVSRISAISHDNIQFEHRPIVKIDQLLPVIEEPAIDEDAFEHWLEEMHNRVSLIFSIVNISFSEIERFHYQIEIFHFLKLKDFITKLKIFYFP